MLSFAPLNNFLKSKGIKKTTLKTEKILNGSGYTFVAAAMKTPVKEGLSISAVNSICDYLKCQPGDIMEWVPDTVEDQPPADA